MKKLFNTLFITLYAIWRHIFGRKYTPKKKVLIVFQQIFGDSIILSNFLEKYVELYKDYEITFICRKGIHAFIKDCLIVPDTINYGVVDFTRLTKEYKYFKEVLNKYFNDPEIILVPGSSLSAELCCYASKCRSKYALVASFERKGFLSFIQKGAYTKRAVPGKDLMMLQRHRFFLEELGAKDCVAKLPLMKSQERVIEGDYVVLSPGSSTPVKCWPIERYLAICEHIIKDYKLPIHMCGAGNDSIYSNYIMEHISDKSMVVDHVNKTGFKEWCSIVQYAKLALGNDSATMHIAASMRVRSICVTGIYDKFQFFPYKVDKLDEGDFLPETMYVEKDCEYCRTLHYVAGYGNKKCEEQIKNGGCALCVSDVEQDLVLARVDFILEGGK